MALEFYDNARFIGKKYASYVKGKKIDYSPEAINTMMGLVAPEKCNVHRRIDECKNWNEEAWEEIKLQLCVEGAKWQGGSHMLLSSDFKPYLKAWASFVVQTLEGTSCTSEIPLVRVHTIVAIIIG